MKTTSTLILAALAAAAIGAAAQAAPVTNAAGKSDCFYSRNIRGFTAVDRETINLQVGGRNDIVQLKLFAPSTELKWANGVALVSHGGSFICSSLDATLVVPGVGGPERFPVTSIRRLTPQEVAALPKKQRP